MIAVALPGGEPYVSRRELEDFANERIRQEIEALRELSLAEFVRAQDSARVIRWQIRRNGGRVA